MISQYFTAADRLAAVCESHQLLFCLGKSRRFAFLRVLMRHHD
jgi:hypothetical protein